MITIGADIHLHCEYKDENGWHNCDNHIWNDKENKYEFDPIYWGRNYDLFGVLAGVRSREFPMIDSPRGLPEDISAKTKEYAVEMKGDAHSYSYLTMKELLKWKKKMTRKWKKLLKEHNNEVSGKDSYYGEYITEDEEDSWGDSWMEITYKYEHEILDYLIKLLKIKMSNHIFCYEKEDYYDKGDDFRIVFWFDS